MAYNDTPNRLESAFIQRATNNQYYEQINISGSDLVIYHDASGSLTADKITTWATKYNIASGGTSVSCSWASHSFTAETASFASTCSVFILFDVTRSVSAIATQSFYSTQSLYATQSLTASYAQGIPTIKSGIVSSSSFGGTTKTASVFFTTPFPDTNYSVVVTGEDSRNWFIQQKSGSSFQINSNSIVLFVGNVFWQAITTGEFYS